MDTTGHEAVLYSFTGGADGGSPRAGVIRDASANLYGTTYYGGAAEAGVVFMLDTYGRETVLHSFAGVTGGGHPFAGVIRDAAGNLYGTTVYGGSVPHAGVFAPVGCGIVYKLDPAGHETVLHAFTAGTDGAEPYGGVVLGAAGNLYGTTCAGGSGTCDGGCGVVYEVDAAGHETVLYRFMGGPDGANPQAGVTRDAGGNLWNHPLRRDGGRRHGLSGGCGGPRECVVPLQRLAGRVRPSRRFDPGSLGQPLRDQRVRRPGHVWRAVQDAPRTLAIQPLFL